MIDAFISRDERLNSQFSKVLYDQTTCERVKLGSFDQARLFELTIRLQVVRLWDKRCSRVAVLVGDVLADCYAFEQNVSIVVDVWDLSERLLFQICG